MVAEIFKGGNMKLEDVDVALEHDTGTIRLSQLSKEDLEQIRALADYIIDSDLFEDRYQAIIAAFHVFADSFVETNLYLESGRMHH